MLSEILSSPVAWFVTIIISIHLSILAFMARQKIKREAEHAKTLKQQLQNSEAQIQKLFDTMDDNRRILTEGLEELTDIENTFTQSDASKENIKDAKNT